jgi:hypothetical protein
LESELDSDEKFFKKIDIYAQQTIFKEIMTKRLFYNYINVRGGRGIF